MSAPLAPLPWKIASFHGQQILEIDLARCDSRQIRERIAIVAPVIARAPANSLLTLTDFSESHYDWETTQALKAYSAGNRAHVRRAAVLGITALKRHILDSVNLFTKREINAFESAHDARLWLVRP